MRAISARVTRVRKKKVNTKGGDKDTHARGTKHVPVNHPAKIVAGCFGHNVERPPVSKPQVKSKDVDEKNKKEGVASPRG